MNLDVAKTLAFLLAGGFLVFLAITITRDNFTNRINRVTGAMLFFAGMGPVFFSLGTIIDQSATSQTAFHNSPLFQIHTLWELFFPTLLMFSWIFPVDRLREFRNLRLRSLVFVPQVMHVAIAIFFTDINRMLESVQIDPGREGFQTLILKPFSYLFTGVLLLVGFIQSYEHYVFGVVNLVYVGAAVYFLESGARYLSEPRLLNQTRVVLWGTRFGLGLYMLSSGASIFFSTLVPASTTSLLLLPALVLGAGAFGYAIVRYQFLDVQLVFRQSFIYTLATAVLVGGYIFLGTRAQRMLTPLFGDRAEMVSYVFLVFVLLLFQPISSWLDNVIRSMFIRTRTDYRTIIERFSRQVISIFDPRQLRQTIEEELKTALLVENVYFVLYDDALAEYTLLPNEQSEKVVIIERDDLMMRGINLLDAPTNFSLLVDYSKGSVLAEMLVERRVKLILPMKDSRHLLGFLALTAKAAGYRYSAEDFNLLGVLSNQMVTSLTNARLYVDSLERLRLQEEINMARQIQLDLLPAAPPLLPTLSISATSIPSRTVGGDFYDFVPIDNGRRLGIVIADASGKGMPAALMMAQIQAMIRSEVNNGNPIPVMVKNMNVQVVQSTSAEKYVTLFYGELDTETGQFHYVNAGHNYPILVRADGSMELLECGGPVIGALQWSQYEQATVILNSSDILFFFTDGLSEAMDTLEREYGEARVRQFIVNRRADEPHALVNAILEDVRKYDPTTPPQDDTTIIALKMNSKNGNDNG